VNALKAALATNDEHKVAAAILTMHSDFETLNTTLE
jgi:hypothetical protein